MRVLFVFVLCAGFLTAADAPKFDPDADMKKLLGYWESDPKGKSAASFKVKDDGFDLRLKGAGFDITMQNSAKKPFDLKEVNGKTVIVVDEKLAKLSDLPANIGYTFDKDVLVLSIGTGPAKGEY